jgi:predicted component of type VI protein secretion system
MPKLHILSGVLEGKTFDLIEERITVGRGIDNMIRLEDGTVSHHHATLILEGSDFTLRDLNSTNGTRVNGLRIVETKLHNGDAVRLGSVEMRYESDVKKSSQPLPPAKTGVDLTQVGLGGDKPPTFSSVSPFGRKQTTKPNYLVWAVLALGLVAMVVVTLLTFKFLGLGGG